MVKLLRRQREKEAFLRQSSFFFINRMMMKSHIIDYQQLTKKSPKSTKFRAKEGLLRKTTATEAENCQFIQQHNTFHLYSHKKQNVSSRLQ